MSDIAIIAPSSDCHRRISQVTGHLPSPQIVLAFDNVERSTAKVLAVSDDRTVVLLKSSRVSIRNGAMVAEEASGVKDGHKVFRAISEPYAFHDNASFLAAWRSLALACFSKNAVCATPVVQMRQNILDQICKSTVRKTRSRSRSRGRTCLDRLKKMQSDLSQIVAEASGETMPDDSTTAGSDSFASTSSDDSRSLMGRACMHVATPSQYDQGRADAQQAMLSENAALEAQNAALGKFVIYICQEYPDVAEAAAAQTETTAAVNEVLTSTLSG